MYRLFVDGKYIRDIGEYEKFPMLGGKNYYLYSLKYSRWRLETSTNSRGISVDKVPKEYRALNLIL